LKKDEKKDLGSDPEPRTRKDKDPGSGFGPINFKKLKDKCREWTKW
jgi:hypothetical protein